MVHGALLLSVKVFNEDREHDGVRLPVPEYITDGIAFSFWLHAERI
jgi:hypothetical protein